LIRINENSVVQPHPLRSIRIAPVLELEARHKRGDEAVFARHFDGVLEALHAHGFRVSHSWHQERTVTRFDSLGAKACELGWF
jgi:hypothetical protein